MRGSTSRSSTATAAGSSTRTGALPRLRGRHRRRALGHATRRVRRVAAQLARLWHVRTSTTPSRSSSPSAARARFGVAHRSSATPARRRTRRRSSSRARRTGGARSSPSKLVPRPHDGRARARPAAREPRGVRAARPGRARRAPGRRRRARAAIGRADRGDLGRAGAGRGRRPAAAAGFLPRRARARRRARRAAPLRRGADRRRPTGTWFGFEHDGGSPTPSRSRRGSAAACRSARCSRRGGSPARSRPATTARRSAATRSRARRRARSSTSSTRSCSRAARGDLRPVQIEPRRHARPRPAARRRARQARRAGRPGGARPRPPGRHRSRDRAADHAAADDHGPTRPIRRSRSSGRLPLRCRRSSSGRA